MECNCGLITTTMAFNEMSEKMSMFNRKDNKKVGTIETSTPAFSGKFCGSFNALTQCLAACMATWHNCKLPE